MGSKKNKKCEAQNVPFSTLPQAQQMRLRQRQMVLTFHLVFLVGAILSCLFPWYTIHYGDFLIKGVAGVARPEGKVFLAALIGAGFFASFNLMNREEVDWPVFVASLITVGALLWFWYTTWGNQQLFREVAELASFEAAVKNGRGGLLGRLGLNIELGLWFSMIGAVNMILSSAFLLFVQPSTFADD